MASVALYRNVLVCVSLTGAAPRTRVAQLLDRYAGRVEARRAAGAWPCAEGAGNFQGSVLDTQ